jgi:tetratricopeptide (TPR) repeat protein
MPTLALSMIVKNAERHLPDCLQSVQGIVDDIVIADTGSTDSSVEIARRAGARVFSIPWENDFAKARNLSLAEVKADWVFVLDADERVDANAAKLLPTLLGDEKAAGFQVTIRNYVATLGHKIWDRTAKPNTGGYGPAREYPAYVDHENVRLFRRDPEIYFTGRVHETVGWRIVALKRKIGSPKLLIHHMGMIRDDEERARKILFYLELSKQKVEDMPGNSQAHFELGVSLLENLGNTAEALASFERSCELNPRFDTAWFFMGVCCSKLAQPDKALDCFRRAEAAGYSSPLLSENIGDAYYNLGDFQASLGSYRRGLKRDPANASIESKLGLAEVRAGKSSAGLRRMRNAAHSESSNPELHDRLIMAELWLRHFSQGAEAAENKLEAVTPQPADFLRAASIRSKMEDWPRAATILRKGLTLFPDSEPLNTGLSNIETFLNGAPVPVEQRANR